MTGSGRFSDEREPALGRRALAAVLICMLCLVWAPTPVHARALAVADNAQAIEWGVRLLSADGAPKNRLEFHLSPGERAGEVITVVNRGTLPLHLEVRVEDAVADDSGAVRRVVGSSSAGSGWVTPARNELEIPPGSSRDLEFAVEAPRSASAGYTPAALVLRQDAGDADAGAVPVQRELAVLVHLYVGGEASMSAVPIALIFALGALVLLVAIGLIRFVKNAGAPKEASTMSS